MYYASTSSFRIFVLLSNLVVYFSFGILFPISLFLASLTFSPLEFSGSYPATLFKLPAVELSFPLDFLVYAIQVSPPPRLSISHFPRFRL